MKRLVVLNFFPAFLPPKSGGELRLVNLYAALSRRFRIDLVSWTVADGPAETVRLTETFTDHRIPKGAAHESSYRTFARQGIGGELAGISCALAGRTETPYHAAAADLIARADAVIHEFPYTLDYDRTLGRDGKPRLYNAHNVEADMVRALTGSRAVHDLVFGLERRLVDAAALVFATSAEERLKFQVLYGAGPDRIALCPNGVAEAEFAWAAAPGAFRSRERRPADRLTALFFGSDHPPNVQAGRFIMDRLAPAFPATDFVIAGSVCAALGPPASGNLTLLGPLDAEAKHEILRAADLFLNPIAEGAGTSLKVLEAMAAGLPVLSTEAGIRGLDLADGGVVAVDTLARFPRRLVGLLARPELRGQMGLAAHATVAERFGWRHIAEAAGDRIARLLDAGASPPRPTRPLVLAANDYPVARPIAGGALRIHRLLEAVGRRRDVVHLCFGRGTTIEIEPLAPGVHELRIPRTAEHAALIDRINAGRDVGVDDLVAAVAATRNPELAAYFGRLAARASALVFAHPYLLPLLQLTGRTRPVLLDLHNVEAVLKAGLLERHPDADLLVPFVEALEAFGCAMADRIVTVSAEDAAEIARRHGPGSVTIIPNGADLCPAPLVEAARGARRRRDWSQGFAAVFVGSGHAPNITAARLLVERVLPALPAMRLGIIGGVADALGDHAGHPRLDLFGPVDAARKRALLLAADVALNPVASGGGSNLKMADYFSHALPVVTTQPGARGFAIENGVTALVVGPADFPAALDGLGASPDRREALALAGRDLATSDLGWDRLGEAFADLVPEAPVRRRLRLLVATYRFTEPALGGAEAYLAALLGALDARGDVTIDLEAVSVGDIFNLSRFIAHAPGRVASAADAIAPYLRRLTLHPPDATDPAAETAACWRLYHLWQAEALALGRAFAGQLDRPLPLGGWHPPEWADGAPWRWSAGIAELFVPPGFARLHLDAWHETPGARLDCAIDGVTVASIQPAAHFALDLDLDPATGGIVRLAMTPPRPADDVLIERGLALTRAALETPAGAIAAIDLGSDAESFAAGRLTAAWVERVMAVALARDAASEADFQALRGPHSGSLLASVEQAIGGYDVVLIQGVPFGLSVEVGAIARAAGVPYVVLPHFHVEDRFYHWRAYYELFAGAAAVLSFSTGPAGALIERVGGRAAAIPGGGIDPAEFVHAGQAAELFRARHPSARPYFLVLGRKSGSKRGDLVVEAWQTIRAALGVDLVFVGPDEGAPPPAQPGLYDYGQLPRLEVVGALAGAIALVTMSESESFGIVILEAWMCARPVIAQAGTLAFAELVTDGVDGLLVADAGGLAAAMRRLAEDTDLADALGAGGRDKAEAYAWPTLAATLRETLERAASSGAS